MDVDLVWVRCFQWKGRDVFTLAREFAPDRWLTAADVRKILGDEPPVIAYDDSGPGGALIFPVCVGCGVDAQYPLLAEQLAEQLRTAIRRKAAGLPCPAEAFPEPGAPDDVADVDADDFAEPAGGESARVLREEVAHIDALRAAKAAAARFTPDSVEHHRYGGWKSGDRFIVHDRDDVARAAAAAHLWPIWGERVSGAVIARCDVHHTGHDTSAGLLIDCEGIKRPIVVSPRVLSACARKVL